MRLPAIWRVLLLAAVAAAPSGCGTQPPATDPPDAASSEKSWQDHTQGLPFVIGSEPGLQQARTEGKPAMMFVTTAWCGWCKRLAHDSFNDPDVKDLLSNFVCIIVDGDIEGAVKSKLGADQGYPHIVFLSAEGEKIGECLGYRPLGEFKPIVQEALAASGRL